MSIVRDEVQPGVHEPGLNETEAPSGRPLDESVTSCALPETSETLTVAVTAPPCCTVTVAGVTPTEKLKADGGGGGVAGGRTAAIGVPLSSDAATAPQTVSGGLNAMPEACSHWPVGEE